VEVVVNFKAAGLVLVELEVPSLAAHGDDFRFAAFRCDIIQPESDSLHHGQM
jgi:hypothetical protein